jgi:NADH-quinone oxidoreductase subunit N
VNADAFIALGPLLILAAGAILLMLQISFARGLRLSHALTQLTLLLAALSAIPAGARTPLAVTPLLQADRPGLLLCALFCIAAAATAALSYDYLKQRSDEPEEYFLLLVLSTIGACVLTFTVHLASLLLGLELMSVSLYALIAYPDRAPLPLEAAIKYLVLSGAASATSLFGFALLYAATGVLGFAELGVALGQLEEGRGMVMVAAAMIVAGLGFKLSVVPFHLWTPDVYEGAPSPISGFLAAVSKAAVVVVLLRLFFLADLFRYGVLVELIGLLALLSMLAGNLLALLQSNIKRMLAYSSIAHIGYLLIVFMVVLRSGEADLAIEAAIYYLVAYAVTTVAAFGVLALLCCHDGHRETVELSHLTGLLWRYPLLGLLMLVSMLSLAGIPLTAGFIAKFYVLGAAVQGGNWVLIAALVIGSAIGIYYYLRVVFTMARQPVEHPVDHRVADSRHVQILSLALIAAILVLGTVPQPLMDYLRSIL